MTSPQSEHVSPQPRPHLAAILSGLLAMSGLVGCEGEDDAAPDEAFVISFDARVGAAPATCGTAYPVGAAGETAELADARLFVSAVELKRADGEWVAATLDEDGAFQGQGVALLDFEDKSGLCDESGTTQTNEKVSGTLPAGEYEGLRFVVGVPFELNHTDASTQNAPLNAPGMFWVWQAGYKFLRVDWSFTVDAQPSRWNMHIGSTQCASDAPTMAPAEACGRPNRAVIELPDFVPGRDQVVIDFAALGAEANMPANTAETPPGCQSSPMEAADCEPVFSSLGLDFGTGACVNDCEGQTVFFTENL